MKEGERSRIDGLKNSVKEIVLEDPGMEEAYIASTDDSYHGQMNNSSQFLTYVESMHLMEGHPFRDIVRLLRNYSLFYNPSTLETMEWIQDWVIVSLFHFLPT